MTQADMADKARSTLRLSWAFTAILGVPLAIATFASAGAGGIILAPLVVYCTWSLFWGFPPVWRGLSNMMAGWGCAGTWMFLLIVAVVLIELLVVISVAYGALGGGISRYRAAKRMVESFA